MALDLEANALGGQFLAALEFVITELKDLLACQTNHVVVVLVAEHVLEATTAIAGLEPFNKTSFFQHRQGAIDGGTRDFGIGLAAQLKQLLGGEVIVRRQCFAHDQRPLVGPAEATLAQRIFDDARLLLRLRRPFRLRSHQPLISRAPRPW